MGVQRLAHVVCLAVTALLFATPRVGMAVPTEVGGGGSKSTDCLTTFKAEVTFPSANPRHVRCTDGDPGCDADLTVDGVCTIPIVVCANSTSSGNCTLNGLNEVTVDHAVDTPADLKFDPDFQALQGRINADILAMTPNTTANDCTTASNVRVPIKGPLGPNNSCSRGKTKTVRLTSRTQILSGRVYTDVDVIKVQCDPQPASGCDPQQLFASTFDRIQKQVFNQNCALSGCHTSASVAGGLLLETGASYTNLVEMDPLNIAAFNAGWKRVNVTVQDVSGDTATSYLFHKVEGDSPDSTYGNRMPLNRPKLHTTLRDIVKKWILNGAPASGWVPGTF